MEQLESSFDEQLAGVVYATMRESERLAPSIKHCGDSEYLKCRKTLVGWVIEVCEAFGLSNITTFHACHLMDRVFTCDLLNKPTKRQSFQLIAMTCILIAAKFGETDDKLPSMEELNDMSRNTYTIEIFQKVEASVLNFLSWEIVAITPICYMKRFLAKTSTGNPDVDYEINKTMVLLLGLALQDHMFNEYPPSMVCASAVLCSRAIVHRMGGHFDVWSPVVERELHYTSDELSSCSTLMYSRFREFTNHEAEQEGDETMDLIQAPSPTTHYTS